MPGCSLWRGVLALHPWAPCNATRPRAPARPMPAGANPYFQLTEEEAIELTKAEMEENP